MASAQKFRWLVAVIGVLLAVAGGGWLLTQSWSWKPAQETKLPPVDPLLPTSPVSRPALPPEGYVGSAVCANCHEDLCKTFAQHPMGRSSSFTPGPTDVEDFSAEKGTFTAADGTRYRAEKVGDLVLHHEIGTDSQGRTRYDRKVPVSLAIGSGTRGKTYVANRDGILIQSPISWYSAKGGYFELSPGYERSGSNQHFNRRVFEACLICHVGRMEFDPEVRGKLSPPYVHEIAIGCERCHGPGDKHVAAQQAGKSASPDPTIVNPARLPMHERESVCYQCHLHGAHREVRYGRNPRDFRPGMPIEEIFCVLVMENPSHANSKAVSQVEQMRESSCFRGSSEKMGCISCHNPHEWPEPQKRDAYFRSRCIECHAEKGCSLSVQKRAEQGDSCIACHMPRTTPKDVVHASQTDHRVLKNPAAAIKAESPSVAENVPQGFKLFGDGDKRLPHWEMLRARGLMLASEKAAGNPQESTISLLLPLAQVAPDDIPLLLALGEAYMQREDNAQARKWLEKIVALEPKNEQALTMLVLACMGMRDLDAAKSHIREVVAINPHVAKNFAIQAQILADSGEQAQALQAAEKVMELDPTQTSLRDWLLRAKNP